MPQKKNPDSLELLRGKSGRVFGQVRLFCLPMPYLGQLIPIDGFLGFASFRVS